MFCIELRPNREFNVRRREPTFIYFHARILSMCICFLNCTLKITRTRGNGGISGHFPALSHVNSRRPDPRVAFTCLLCEECLLRWKTCRVMFYVDSVCSAVRSIRNLYGKHKTHSVRVDTVLMVTSICMRRVSFRPWKPSALSIWVHHLIFYSYGASGSRT